MDVFWHHGYEGASMQHLAEATGLNRSSIYNTFGSKHALYLAALDRYRRVTAATLLDPLGEALPLQNATEKVLQRVIDESLCGPANASSGRPSGCFVACATLDRAPHDPETARRVADSMAVMEAAFHRRFVQAQRDGELGSEKNPLSLARFFVSAVNGLRVLGQSTGDRAVLTDVMRTTLSVLG